MVDRSVWDAEAAGSNPVTPIRDSRFKSEYPDGWQVPDLDQLEDKIKELRNRFDLSFQDMLEAEDIHNLSQRIDRLHTKLFELSGEVERVIRESFKNI